MRRFLGYSMLGLLVTGCFGGLVILLHYADGLSWGESFGSIGLIFGIIAAVYGFICFSMWLIEG